MQSQIENAMKVTSSNRAAARYLRVSFDFYKKWAQLYKNSEGASLYEAHKNQGGAGVSKAHLPKNSQGHKIPLDEILMGKYPNYPRKKLFKKIL